MRIYFDFGDLSAFTTVAELGSFHRAAEQLHISQSALSRRIQKLEDVLRVTLIERTTRSMKLTVAARSFLPRAQAMLDDAAEAVRAVGDDSSRSSLHRSRIVTVATVPTATHNILPTVIRDFRNAGHSARIRIHDLSANDVLEAVALGEADFGINFIGSQEPGLTFQPLMNDNFVLAINRTDPLAKRRRIRWSDVEQDRFIAVWKGSGNRVLIDSALAQSRQALHWTYEVRHLSTALALVEAGVGITALPESALPAKNHPLVTARQLVEPAISRTIGTVRRTGSTLPSMAEKFHAVLLKRWSTP